MRDSNGQPDSVGPGEEVKALVQNLPLLSDDLAFDEPWQLRAFALAIAAHKSGQYPWSDFQSALIASIKGWEGVGEVGDAAWSYHEHWLDAIQAVMVDNDLVDVDLLEERVREVLDMPANRNHHEPHYEPVAVDPGC